MQFRKTLTVLLVAFVCLILFAAALMAAYALPVQDFAQYWAAARLFTHDPYSVPQTQALEKASGLVAAPLVVKNPPWAIVLMLPLGALGYHSAFAIWTVISVCIVAACSKAVWNQIGSGPSLAPALLSMVFGPTIVLLMLGQFTVLVLLGAVLFCALLRKRRDWLAGASLLLVLGKPHIALLFLIAAALWTLFYRRWIVLISGTLALTSASIAAIIINPHIFAQFWRRTILVVNETESYPNFGGMLYAVSGMHALALLPQLAGLIWLAFYWLKNRSTWDWEKHGAIVLLCSVACSYYSYPYDEILALPALIFAFAKGERRVFLAVFALTNLGYGLYISNVTGHFGFGYMFLWWTATGWLFACCLALRRVGAEPSFSD
ncbi:glycosyltransferase family 87 protein [Telmatobacter sp. DSM 110680]|uniref:Glycosyltransferase family 87 protein n=1 Tax=Telmatobacter sp. DSM 110680 TaxID=3036704 RepID=A0AAU7DHZ7_9BACT